MVAFNALAVQSLPAFAEASYRGTLNVDPRLAASTPIRPDGNRPPKRMVNQLCEYGSASGGYLKGDGSIWRLGLLRGGIGDAGAAANPRGNHRWLAEE